MEQINPIQIIIPHRIVEKIRDGLYVIDYAGVQIAISDVDLKRLYKEIHNVLNEDLA